LSDGNYFFLREGETIFFKFKGNLKYSMGSKFDAFLDKFLESGGACMGSFNNIIIDLSEADFIDSTNLGFLAKIADFVDEKYNKNKKVTIYSPKEDINTILESVRFDEVFLLLKENIKNSGAEFKEINGDISKKDRDMATMMLEAHQALVKVNEKNADAFCDVIDLLQESVKKSDSQK
jgi:anti-anti-sigma regulatory factor